MSNFIYKDIIIIFIITAAFDIALNLTPPPVGAVILREYFDNHTILAAALIAGFVGAITLAVIYYLFGKIPELSIRNMTYIFIISALMGTPMRYSNLFPLLDKYYYQKIPRIQSFLADGLSGVMVAAVYYFILYKKLL
mgnify:FL=1